MNNLPRDLRKKLDETFRLRSSSVSAELEDSDGTVKFQIRLKDGNRVEAVILRDGKERKTACLSVQAGCPSGCVFCKTARLGFKRNLSGQEIAEEFLHLAGRENNISHIVFMGMGEPFLNLEEVHKAVSFFCDTSGLAFSKRRITVSTCGIINGLRNFTEAGPDIRLALSLVTARQDLRARLMPITLSNPLPDLKEELILYQEKRRRRITLEIVLLKGINTGNEDAAAIAAFAKGLDVVVNLIPWNPAADLLFENNALKTPSPPETAAFASALTKLGLNVTRRLEKGRSISGACGQLGVLE
jgi:23S rRNA (adenine2503-C2)-methyltransferase